MNKVNTTLWAFCGLIGYLIGTDLYSALFGVTVGIGFSFLVTIIDV